MKEAEIVKQVRESDVPETRHQPMGVDASAMTTAHSSPNLSGIQEAMEEIPADDAMAELGAGLSSSFKQHAMKNSKGKQFWDTFSDSSGARTPPPASSFLPRGSSSGMSEDANMDSPLQSAAAFYVSIYNTIPPPTLMPLELNADPDTRTANCPAPRKSRGESTTSAAATTTSTRRASSAAPSAPALARTTRPSCRAPCSAT